MRRKKVYVIYCEDGLVCRGEKGQVYWSWDFESMNVYGKTSPNLVAKHLMSKFIHDSMYDFELIFLNEDKKMKELL